MTVEIGDGRRLGVAEYGPASGRPVLWFHGTPGGRRQIPESLRTSLPRDDVRLVVVERPGYGASTPHAYPNVLAVTDDVGVLLDALAIDRFGVAALSGGGPYALACAYAFPERVVAASILGGVAPHVGDDAAPGGLVHLLAPLGPVAGPLARPVGMLFQGLVAVLAPLLGTTAVDLAARIFPPGDQRVFAAPENKVMFLDDIVQTVRGGLPGPALDLRVFVRDWGFRLVDLQVPVHFWHGDADPIVTIEQARRMADRVPGATFVLRPEESHLGGFAAAHEAVARAMTHWEDR
jgi:pimeloyl-ACP methyl ester carboxylesterase